MSFFLMSSGLVEKEHRSGNLIFWGSREAGGSSSGSFAGEANIKNKKSGGKYVAVGQKYRVPKKPYIGKRKK